MMPNVGAPLERGVRGVGRARRADNMSRNRRQFLCRALCVSHQSFGNKFKKVEAELGILVVHLAYLVVRERQESSVLFADDCLRSAVLLGYEAEFSYYFTLFECHVSFNDAETSAEYKEDVSGRVALAEQHLSSAHRF